MIASTLNFGTSCRECGRGLLIDCEGERYCADCTSFRPAAIEPFVATVGAEEVDRAESLDAMLATLAEIMDTTGPEDVTVWQGIRLVMVLCANGEVIDRRGNPPF